MFSNSAIAERAIGGYPLSIATSLALESACGVHPEIPVEKPPILDYQELWINLRTLFRNFMGALSKDGANSVIPPHIAEALSGEMETIESIIGDVTRHRVKVVFYYSNYANLEIKYRHATVRRDNTDKQKEYTLLHNRTMKLLLEAHQHSDSPVLVFDLKLKPKDHVRAMILTHYAYDLVAYKEFAKLALVESHTGAIKERAQWYTKYYQGRELSMIPFREDFLQVFGDNETFRPGDPSLRKELIAIATKNRWSAITTKDKIIYGINQMSNPFYRDTLKDMLA